MANRQVLALLLLGVSLVFAALPDEHHLDVKVADQDVVTSESIDINYKRKYVKISSSGQRGTQEGSMLHDYTQGLNVLKQHGECYILDKFNDIPQDIKDWERVESSITSDIIPDDSRHVNYGYNALPYLVNRTASPESVQEFCPGPIRVVVLDDVTEQEEARDQEEEPRDEDGERRDEDDEPREDDEDESSDDQAPAEVIDNEEEMPTDIFIPKVPAVQQQEQPHLRQKRGWGRRRRRRRFWRRVGRFVRRVVRHVRVRFTVRTPTTPGCLCIRAPCPCQGRR